MDIEEGDIVEVLEGASSNIDNISYYPKEFPQDLGNISSNEPDFIGQKVKVVRVSPGVLICEHEKSLHIKKELVYFPYELKLVEEARGWI
jgi:hypothetical protein